MSTPQRIEFARQLLTQIDGETQEAAACMIADAIDMISSAKSKDLMDVLRTCEAALRDAEECLPRWEILADMMKNHCQNVVHNAAVIAKAHLKGQP